MRADRPAKAAVRKRWLRVLNNLNVEQGAHPIYLTLPGMEGKDIQLLIDKGLIELTETGAIADDSVNYCVAIENSPPAVLELQRRFPGLRILQQDVKSVLRGESVLQYPEKGEHRTSCQAHVINLDLPETLEGHMMDSGAFFPVLRWIEKFGTLQSECPHSSWHLLLTLNASIQWPNELCDWVRDFLRGNFEVEAGFQTTAVSILGDELMRQIMNGESIRFNTLTFAKRQKLLLVLIPKAVSNHLCHQGWELDTRLNAMYPGTNDAPMVTFIFALSKAGQHRRRDNLYSQALAACLAKVERITREGDFEGL